MDSLPQVLHVAADTLKSFRADADLDLQPAKFKIHIKGVSHEQARALIEKCIDSDEYLTCLRPMMPLVVFKLMAFALQVCLLNQMLSSLTMFVRRRLTSRLFKMLISLTL